MRERSLRPQFGERVIDFSRGPFRLFGHQKLGVEKLVTHSAFFLADEMGAGKTCQTIYAACVLWEQGLVDRVVVVTPAVVRSVWFDAELGELKKHLWPDVPALITEYHQKRRQWKSGPDAKHRLRWVVTNYDFIRQDERREELQQYCNERTLLVLDESSKVKNHRAAQTKACKKLRKACGRVLLLNGTPIANNPGDLYAQADIIDPKIFDCKNFFQFRARYARMGGYLGRQIVGWHDVEDIQRRLAPFILRRLKEDCLDLPPKLPSVPLLVPLTEKTWKTYKSMRDEFLTWLDDTTVATASQAGVKAMRLAQICAGFVGGIEASPPGPDDRPEWLPLEPVTVSIPEWGGSVQIHTEVAEVGREKLDLFLSWLGDQLDADPSAKILVLCRFRPELARMANEIGEKFPQVEVGRIHGQQKEKDRDHAKALLDPRRAPKGPAVVVGITSSGSLGLTLTAAHTVIYTSNDYSYYVRKQSEDRVHRPGQTYPVSYFDVIATGPAGQQTVDHIIHQALTKKEDLATWTCAAWRNALRDQRDRERV